METARPSETLVSYSNTTLWTFIAVKISNLTPLNCSLRSNVSQCYPGVRPEADAFWWGKLQFSASGLFKQVIVAEVQNCQQNILVFLRVA